MKLGWIAAGVVVGVALGGELAAAQERPAFARVRGYVFDSLLTRTTMPGAVVFITGPATVTVVADGRGRFDADSLPPGSYALTFSHARLDEIGYVAPEQKVELRAGVVTPVFLSTTAGNHIFAAACPNVLEEQTGVVLGQLVEVRGGLPVEGGEVRVEWNESVVSATLGVSSRVRTIRAPTDSAGRFRLCGVPNDVSVLLRARARGVEGPPLELSLEERPVAIRRLMVDLSDPAGRTGEAGIVETGTAVVRGTVMGNDGRAVPEAQVLVLGLSAGTRTAEGGGFELGGLPAGTHTVEIRAIGYARRRELVDLLPDRPARLEVTLTRIAVTLPEIAVTAEDPGQTEFDQRRRFAGGGGSFLDEEDIARRNPLRTEDLFRSVPGFSVVPSGGFDYRIVSTRGPGASGQCSPDVFLDGSRITLDPAMGGGLPVNPQELYGIEAYPSGAFAPAQYSSQSSCGVVLIWTKRGRSRR